MYFLSVSTFATRPDVECYEERLMQPLKEHLRECAGNARIFFHCVSGCARSPAPRRGRQTDSSGACVLPTHLSTRGAAWPLPQTSGKCLLWPRFQIHSVDPKASGNMSDVKLHPLYCKISSGSPFLRLRPPCKGMCQAKDTSRVPRLRKPCFLLPFSRPAGRCSETILSAQSGVLRRFAQTQVRSESSECLLG